MNAPFNPEQRLTFRLLSYWNRIRGERKMPSLGDLNIAEIEEIWHFSFTIAVNEDPHRFSYFGPSLATVFGEDFTRATLPEAMENIIVNNTIGFYGRAMDSKEPCLEAASFWSEGDEVKYRSIIVPLSSDGETVDFVMGTTNYKRFAGGK